MQTDTALLKEEHMPRVLTLPLGVSLGVYGRVLATAMSVLAAHIVGQKVMADWTTATIAIGQDSLQAIVWA